jgi:hypothetical protein
MPCVAKLARIPIKTALAVTAVVMVVDVAVLAAAILAAVFGANPYRKPISL